MNITNHKLINTGGNCMMLCVKIEDFGMVKSLQMNEDNINATIYTRHEIETLEDISDNIIWTVDGWEGLASLIGLDNAITIYKFYFDNWLEACKITNEKEFIVGEEPTYAIKDVQSSEIVSEFNTIVDIKLFVNELFWSDEKSDCPDVDNMNIEQLKEVCIHNDYEVIDENKIPIRVSKERVKQIVSELTDGTHTLTFEANKIMGKKLIKSPSFSSFTLRFLKSGYISVNARYVTKRFLPSNEQSIGQILQGFEVI